MVPTRFIDRGPKLGVLISIVGIAKIWPQRPKNSPPIIFTNLKIVDFLFFLDKFWIFYKCLIVLICVTVLRIVNNFDNCTDNPGDLWHLRNSDNWEPEFMTIFVTWNFKSDTGQHSQFLRCFILHLHRPAISMCSTASTFPLISVFQIFFTLSHFLSYHPVVQQGCALYTARAQ